MRLFIQEVTNSKAQQITGQTRSRTTDRLSTEFLGATFPSSFSSPCSPILRFVQMCQKGIPPIDSLYVRWLSPLNSEYSGSSGSIIQVLSQPAKIRHTCDEHRTNLDLLNCSMFAALLLARKRAINPLNHKYPAIPCPITFIHAHGG